VGGGAVRAAAAWVDGVVFGSVRRVARVVFGEERLSFVASEEQPAAAVLAGRHPRVAGVGGLAECGGT
jgi:hypothetical protein